MPDKKWRVAIIGVGLMGHGLARNILKNGHALSFFEHAGNQPTDDLTEMGARSSDSIASLVSEADIALTCVTGSSQVEEVVFRQDGLLSGLKPGTIVIDCSTAVPGSTRKVAAAVEEAGARFIDAAMTRTSKEAEEGRLGLIVGGDKAVFEEVEPLLRCFAESIAHVGPVSSGHTMKLLHNYVSLGFSALLAEASAAAVKAGVDRHVFAEVLNSGAGDGVIFRRLRPFIEDDDPTGMAFSLVNASKDLTYYNQMADEFGAASRIAKSVVETVCHQRLWATLR